MNFSRAGLNARPDCPLNQNGLPAASLAPLIAWPVGATRPSGFLPLTGKLIVWKPVGAKRTESPTWMVTPLGKKLLTSELYFWLNVFWSFTGKPMSTVRVAACADTGVATTIAATIAANVLLRRCKDISLSLEGRPGLSGPLRTHPNPDLTRKLRDVGGRTSVRTGIRQPAGTGGGGGAAGIGPPVLASSERVCCRSSRWTPRLWTSRA